MTLDFLQLCFNISPKNILWCTYPKDKSFIYDTQLCGIKTEEHQMGRFAPISLNLLLQPSRRANGKCILNSLRCSNTSLFSG